jgi:hypothetical protein
MGWPVIGFANYSPLDTAEGMTIDSLGNVYVADTRNARVQVYDGSGNYLRTIGTKDDGGKLTWLGDTGPKAVAVDSSFNVYVSDTAAHRVVVYDPAGNYVRHYGVYSAGWIQPGDLNVPRGLAVDQDGRVWVTDLENHVVQIFDPLSRQQEFVPPAGHMAGIWSRSDDTRGVHKAPANEVVRGAVSLETQITSREHDLLNPQGINCIRAFPGRGVRVWGARTLSSDPAWRYLNVRRLFNFIEESILEGTQWVVFEPNDLDLWQRIRRTITAFLLGVWRDGALFGATPEEAFYVKCDSETNPPDVVDAGQVVVEIGIAPVKPAEFVVFRIAQFSGGALVNE